MSINSIGNTPPAADHRSNNAAADTAAAKGAGTDQQAAAGATAKSADTVHISSKAVDLQALEARINELPEVDTSRVADIRNQIASGQYEIDAGRLADKILAFDSSL